MKSNDFAAAPQNKISEMRSKDRRNNCHLPEWRLFFSVRPFWVSLMKIVTEYFRT